MRLNIKVFIATILVTIMSTANAGYLPKLGLGNADSGVILDNNWVQIGETVFSGTTTKVFAKSRTTTTQSGKANVFEVGWGNGSADADNTFYTDSLGCGSVDVIALASKDVDAKGKSSVSLDYRFTDAPVENLKLAIFDVDESHNGLIEKVIINAYDDIRARKADKIDPRKWDILGMGDLSLVKQAPGGSALKVTLPPYWYTIKAGTEENFGLLQARKKANQNRDYTVLQMPDAIKRLRINFSAARGGSSNEIGSHIYVGLWHDDQPCRN